MLSQLIKRSVAFLFALVITPLAYADKHHDLSDPTQWAYFSNADSAALNTQINLGYRIVDLDVVQASPLRFDAALVRNTGTYSSGWWWYTDQTLTQLGNLAVANNARLIEISAYQAAAGLRYAGVMIPNTGSEQEPFVLRENLTVAGVAAWRTKGDFQGSGVVYDIEAYSTASGTRYAIIGLGNAFSSPDTIEYRLGLTSAALATAVALNSSRILDLEVEPNGTFAAAFSYLDGQRLILRRSTWAAEDAPAEPGTIVTAHGDELRIATGAGTLVVTELQAEGRRPMTTRDFLAGRPVRAGARFESGPDVRPRA